MRRVVATLPVWALIVACEAGEAGHQAAPPEGLEVNLPALAFTARSQVWALDYNFSTPWVFRLHLVSGAEACSETAELGSSGLTVSWDCWVPVGEECPVRDPDADHQEPGCGATVIGFRVDAGGRYHRTEAVAGTVRIDQAGDGRLAGRVRASFPHVLGYSSRCTGYGGDHGLGTCSCVTPERSYTCSRADSRDLNCCDDGFAVSEVELSFDAEACPAAAGCFGIPCPPRAIGACTPPPDDFDCEAGCAGSRAVCASCSGCAPGDDQCLRLACGFAPDCQSLCASVVATDPTFRTALRCATRETGCEGWNACMAGCGEP